MTKQQKLAELEELGRQVLLRAGIFIGASWFITILSTLGMYDSGFWIMIETVSAISLFITILIDYFISKTFYAIALDKGYYNRMYFWFCFIIGPIGYTMVLAMPDRGDKDEEPATVKYLRSRTIKEEKEITISQNSSNETSEKSILGIVGNSISHKINNKNTSNEDKLSRYLIVGIVAVCLLLVLFGLFSS